MQKKTNVRLNLLQEVKRRGEVLVSAEVELAVVDRSGSIKKLNKASNLIIFELLNPKFLNEIFSFCSINFIKKN